MRSRASSRAEADCGHSRRECRYCPMNLASIPFRMPRINLQARILALFLALMAVMQVGGFVLVNTVGTTAARSTIGNELIAGEQVFVRSLQQEKVRLIQGARLLAADYAFREAIATGDRDTIVSVLANHGKRIDADLTMLIALDGKVSADTLGGSAGTAFPSPSLLAAAQSDGEAGAMVLLARWSLPSGARAGAGTAARCLGRHWIQGRRRARPNPARANAISCIAVQPPREQAAGNCRRARLTLGSASRPCAMLQWIDSRTSMRRATPCTTPSR